MWMPGRYEDIYVMCPYYQWAKDRSVICEGLTHDCTLELNFKTKDSKKTHMECFCNDKYQCCELFKILEKKYED